MIEALIAGGEDPKRLADLAQRQLRGKIPGLEKALEGRLTEHHRFMLQLLWKELRSVENLLAEMDPRITEVTRPLQAQKERLVEVPRIERRVAEVVLAEVGSNVQPFPTSPQLASWAGMCPGNEKSAGKRRTGRTTPVSRWLRQALVQAAWAASHTRDRSLAAQYWRLAARRGKK